MLGMIGNQLVRFEPAPEPHMWSLGLEGDGDQLVVRADNEVVTAGVRYFVLDEDKSLDVTMSKETGKFTTEGWGVAKLRAVLGDLAMDLSYIVQPPISAGSVA